MGLMGRKYTGSRAAEARFNRGYQSCLDDTDGQISKLKQRIKTLTTERNLLKRLLEDKLK